jgi:phospholipase/carboxylesterase
MRDFSPFTRREFLGIATAGVGALLTACQDAASPAVQNIEDMTVTPRPGIPTTAATVGFTPLGIGTDRDGFLYVPPSYDPAIPAPLLVLLHGSGGDADNWRSAPHEALFAERGLIVVATDSRAFQWDLIQNDVYGPDVAFLNSALTFAFARCNVDSTRIGIGGFADGASEALGLGVANGDLFSAVLAFSPSRLFGPFRRGEPRFFVSHGSEDTVLSISVTRNLIVPALREVFPVVTFVEFQGGHTIPADVEQQALDFLVSP